MRARMLLPAALALTVLAALVPGAGASHQLDGLISIGPNGGNGALDAQFQGSSRDGLTVFFETDESLVSADTDAQSDVYSRDDTGATTLISTGPAGGNGPFPAFFKGASSNGGRVFFETTESLVSGDQDSRPDVYERSGGATSRRSLGPIGGNGAHDAVFRGISDNGMHVFFETTEALVSADSDDCSPSAGTQGCADVYDRSGGATTLVSTGAPGNGAFNASFVHTSADGSRVLFDTREQLVAGDSDSSIDLYQRVGGATVRRSLGPTGGNGAFDAFFAGASEDGTDVLFHTQEKIVAADTDSRFDVYQRSSGPTTQISTGPGGGNGAADSLLHFVSEDGTRAFFETSESLVAADADAQNDVYERVAGTTNLVSTGPVSSPGTFVATFEGATPDGSRAFFETNEPLVSADTDTQTDVYQRMGGTTTLISTGPAGGNGPRPAVFDGVSEDGGLVFFHTDEQLVVTDTDSFADIYERAEAVTTVISHGPAGGNGPFPADYFGASSDGSRVFMQTDENVVPQDTDSSQDVYGATSAPLYPRPGSATPLRVPLVPAYLCSEPNTTHVGPLDYPSCTPPSPQSSLLTTSSVGRGSAYVRLDAIVGNPSTSTDEADIVLAVNATDVINASGGFDYVGEVLLTTSLRITDRANGIAQSTPATVQDADVSFPVECAGTAGPSGGICSLSTTIDTLIPNFALEGKRTLISALAIELKDAGADGDVVVSGCPPTCGTGDENVYLEQGVFTP